MISKAKHGYSLIELIATMAMAGILAAIAVPSWNKLLPSYLLDSSVRQFLRTPQHKNARGHGECRLKLVYASGATAYTIQRDSTVLVTKPLPEKVWSSQRRYNLFLAKRNRERQPNPAGAKLRWEVQTSGGESDRQSSDLQAE